MPEAAHESPIDALIRRHARGRSVRKIEEDFGLRDGSLSHYLKPSQRGRWPSLKVQERFAAALEAPLTEVSKAFAAESGIELDDDLTPTERELILNFRALEEPARSLAFDFLAMAANRAQHTPTSNETITTTASA